VNAAKNKEERIAELCHPGMIIVDVQEKKQIYCAHDDLNVPCQ
jgi:hypothetical protein